MTAALPRWTGQAAGSLEQKGELADTARSKGPLVGRYAAGRGTGAGERGGEEGDPEREAAAGRRKERVVLEARRLGAQQTAGGGRARPGSAGLGLSLSSARPRLVPHLAPSAALPRGYVYRLLPGLARASAACARRGAAGRGGARRARETRRRRVIERATERAIGGGRDDSVAAEKGWGGGGDRRVHTAVAAGRSLLVCTGRGLGNSWKSSELRQTCGETYVLNRLHLH